MVTSAPDSKAAGAVNSVASPAQSYCVDAGLRFRPSAAASAAKGGEANHPSAWLSMSQMGMRPKPSTGFSGGPDTGTWFWRVITTLTAQR